MNTTTRGAHISADGAYRYGLWRRWGEGPSISFVMLNPSTADAELDDPTIRRCVGFGKALGFAGLTVVNLYARRARKPQALRYVDDPHGPENAAWLDGRLGAAAAGATTIVCGWGSWLPDTTTAPAFRARATMLGAPLYCLSRTQHGEPRHPLYLAADTPLEAYT